MPTIELIESFSQFARARVDQAGSDLPIDDLYDEWRAQHPPADDLLAIKASLRDMEQGETGQPFDDFAAAFRSRNGIPASP